MPFDEKDFYWNTGHFVHRSKAELTGFAVGLNVG